MSTAKQHLANDPESVKRLAELGDLLDYAESHFGFYDSRTHALGGLYCIAAHTIREPVADFDAWSAAYEAQRCSWMPTKRRYIDLDAACYLSLPQN